MSRGVASFSRSAARRARTLTKLTADAGAARVGVAERTVLRWERGESFPTSHHLGLLAEVLDAAVEDLLPRRAPCTRTMRDHRHLSGLSLTTVADRSGLSPSAIVRLERGTCALALDAASTLARVYRTTVEEVQRACRHRSLRFRWSTRRPSASVGPRVLGRVPFNDMRQRRL